MRFVCRHFFLKRSTPLILSSFSKKKNVVRAGFYLKKRIFMKKNHRASASQNLLNIFLSPTAPTLFNSFGIRSILFSSLPNCLRNPILSHPLVPKHQNDRNATGGINFYNYGAIRSIHHIPSSTSFYLLLLRLLTTQGNNSKAK